MLRRAALKTARTFIRQPAQKKLSEMTVGDLRDKLTDDDNGLDYLVKNTKRWTNSFKGENAWWRFLVRNQAQDLIRQEGEFHMKRSGIGAEGTQVKLNTFSNSYRRCRKFNCVTDPPPQ